MSCRRSEVLALISLGQTRLFRQELIGLLSMPFGTIHLLSAKYPICPTCCLTTQHLLWTSHGALNPIPFFNFVICGLGTLTDPFTKMKRFLEDVTKALHKLNKSKFADLKNQLCRAKADLEGAQHHLSLNTGDSKAKWISYGDDYIRYFFAKIKQRKIATYIYSMQDGQGQPRQVSARQQIDPNIIKLGSTLTVEQ
ncbi:hypothetical protein Cgig2_028226 [Carnegiea gigantea]|uniref:Uncharacterized protein n=1 Tax=Carnegiea gigantea TaxID=171969 RepID=A0A9Q1GR03_9CARY|nr:hypothetical protein Cgig2_028226 [Carnegiea gigantea]